MNESIVGLDWPRKILHVDLDAFYPSVEMLDDPALAGKPVIVGGLGRRGVVASASYEARRFGVHSAMPMAVARRKCPDGVYLRSRFDRYREFSRRVFAIYEVWTERVEPLSLDEAYLDLSNPVSSPVDIAKSIKQTIRERTGLTASAGVSVNKLLAKLASDIDKPDGLTVIAPEEARELLRDLPVEKLWGVGPASAEVLRREGLRTVGDVAAADRERLESLLGKQGRRAWEFAQGRDDREVEPPGRPKSISSETTYERDRASWEEVWDDLERFAGQLEGRLARWELRARTVTLKVRFQDFTTITRSSTPRVPIRTAEALLEVTKGLAERVDLQGRQMRLVGLGTSNLVGKGAAREAEAAERQLTLWSG